MQQNKTKRFEVRLLTIKRQFMLNLFVKRSR